MDLLLNSLKKIGEFMGLYTPDSLHSTEPGLSDEAKAEAKARFSFFTNTEKNIKADVYAKKNAQKYEDFAEEVADFEPGYEDNEAEQETY
jgi:hypothetical protein